MLRLANGKAFQYARPDEPYEWLDGKLVIVSNVSPFTAVDEYGTDAPGWQFDARPATTSEIQEWQDARRAFRRGRSVLQMLDDELGW